MPKDTTIKKIMVIGSGPIIIGQGAEFDYAGTQACMALKEEGYEVILINSNPATIMTDREVADRVYMEPITLKYVSKIIRRERPDAIIPGLGGQTGLNLVIALDKAKVLEECNVKVLGTSLSNIDIAEDRNLFKELCMEIGEPVIESAIASTIDQASLIANEIGFPIILRPAFTLGGTGSGFCDNIDELKKLCESALKLSPVNQVLVEKSIKGYKEVEYEVIRDSNDCAIIVCNMENVDPVGIHTGDSCVVAPSQTLTNKQFQMLRNASLNIIRNLNIEGGCNAQFALDPQTDKYYVIEVNPRVSRSSALASKATGYPIAYVSTKIAIGLRLDEIKLANTYACFEPSIDYIVCKMARFAFDKFSQAEKELSTQMKATGEVMAIGRNFEEAFLKAVRSLENGYSYLEWKLDLTTDKMLERIVNGDDERFFIIAELLRRNVAVKTICNITNINEFFINKISNIIKMEETLSNNNGNLEVLLDAKRMGFIDKYIAKLWEVNESDVRTLRVTNNIKPVYKMMDSCAREFDSTIHYYYSTYEKENESTVTDKQSVVVIGSGPIRIGQGLEFDYSTVHCVKTIQELGYEAIVINSNPGTVSTDYTQSDKLYFEPLSLEDVLNVCEHEKPFGVIVQLGGQTPINLASDLTKHGINILGTTSDAINVAENRDLFEQLLTSLEIKQPLGGSVYNVEDGIKLANKLSYPVIVRPSFVLGGLAMKIVYNEEQLVKQLKVAIGVNVEHPVLIDKYMIGKEIEVDAICDGDNVFIPGIMEHVEKTGVHSGDSMVVYPSYSLSTKVKSEIIEITQKIGLGLKIKGLYNIQFIVTSNEEVYIIEVNPRASRSVPFISKITNFNLSVLATKIALGQTLLENNITNIYHPDDKARFYVKVPMFSFSKIKGLDTNLSPEMKSTGEAIGYDVSLNRALYKGLIASGHKLTDYGTILVTISDDHKVEALDVIRRFYEIGFNIIATEHTCEFLLTHGINASVVGKISDGSNEILERIQKGLVKYILNIGVEDNMDAANDGYLMRTTAAVNNVSTFTSIETINAVLQVIEERVENVNQI